MNRGARINAVLLGIVVVLGAAVYWQVNREVARFEPPLSGLDPAAVSHVAVDCSQCQPRRFERVSGRWLMREPYALPADAAVVSRLLAIATSPVRSRRATSELDLKKVGLEPPMMRLELDDLHLAIGMTDALNGDRYVRSGNTIAMVPDRFSPFLLATPESELDRHLVPPGSRAVALRVDGVVHAELLDAWNAAAASAVGPSGAGPRNEARVRVELALEDDTTITFDLIRGSEAVIARRAQPALSYALGTEQARALLPGDDATSR